jgi:primosomal protein N' (replication factor Y)
MERITYFADVIVPQALPRMLTYRVPHIMNGLLHVGQRVVVPLGKNKLLTGVIRSIHEQVPKQYEAKYIDSILDEYPLVHEQQLKLWEWMADYYCCTVGEVMNAALPAGLKLTSETKFLLLEFDEENTELDLREETIVNALRAQERLSMQEISDLLDLKNVQPILKALIAKRIIISEEEIKEKFKPKITEFVKLGKAVDSEGNLNQLFEELERRRAQKQSDALMMYLRLSEWDRGQQKPVEKLKLQQAANINASVVSAMQEKGIFEIEARETGRLGLHLLQSEKPKELSEAQQAAADTIINEWETKDVCLLHGVTSSGKTEVYSHLIEQTIAQDKQVLFLLPEIALTTQIIHRLRKYFGKRVGVFHSGYSDNERTEVWQKVLSDVPGECDIILGARSALFLPFTRLGLIIVDEEHEQSFKQHDPNPRYHARDSAIWLAAQFGAKVLLGSATPAVETYWNARQGRYGLATLDKRFGGIELPEVILTDIRSELKAKTMKEHFTSHLLDEMRRVIDAGEQIILFQNRRGYTPLWECMACGEVPKCTRCDVALTYHKHVHQLKCHYCGYSTQPVQTCNVCGSQEMKMLGFGTEKIEDDIQTFLKDVKVLRMDLDTTRSKSSYQKIISDFESGQVQVLVGTQMVTKGLDFDNVSLVGILNADKMLNYPDFRSIERGFQIMMQVAGRAGRKNKRGRVLIQTYNPEHWLLDMITKNDYLAFYDKEILERQNYGYPPFVRMMQITLRHKEEDVAKQSAYAVAKVLRPMLGDHLFGPEEPYIKRINNYYRQQFIIKLEKKPGIGELKHKIVAKVKEVLLQSEYKAVRVAFDVDPM